MTLLRVLSPVKAPVIDGSVHPDFVGVADSLRSQLRFHRGGGAVCVYHRGECVVDVWGGARDREGRLWRRDTMAPSFSTTKGVASTLIHIMVDRGLLGYDQRVAHYWPEFAQAGKREITLRHVLAHQSGLYHIRQMIDHADRMLDWEHMVHAIERAEPVHPPGERTGYHGLTYGFLVGEILQRVTGTPFPQLVQDELAQPLGLDGLFVGTPELELKRAAELIWPRRGTALELPSPQLRRPLMFAARSASNLAEGALKLVGMDIDLASIIDALGPRGISSFDFGSPEALRVAIPAGNGLFTARSLSKMYAALAGGGEVDGVRLLSQHTVTMAAERQDEAPGRSVMPFDMRWRLGYHGVFTTRGSPPRAFGHFGFGGSGAWADLERNLAFGFIVNSGMGTPFGDARIARLSAAVLGCADRRAPGEERVARSEPEPVAAPAAAQAG